MQNVTFAMIKPHAVQSGHVGEIISRIERSGFKLLAIKQLVFNNELLNNFYAEHIGKSFFVSLEEEILSGPVIALVLQHPKGDTVIKWREIIGSTNPDECFIGTIRYDYATSITCNAVHGSDSNESAQREISIIFPNL